MRYIEQNSVLLMTPSLSLFSVLPLGFSHAIQYNSLPLPFLAVPSWCSLLVHFYFVSKCWGPARLSLYPVLFSVLQYHDPMI